MKHVQFMTSLTAMSIWCSLEIMQIPPGEYVGSV